MREDIPLNKRIIFALDVNTKQDAEKWVNRLKDVITFYKIGLELFVSEGFAVVDTILNKGFDVMLDLKLYDIPKTVNRTVKQIAKRNIAFLTVHGNYDILQAAVEGASDSNLEILGVTVLTSLDERDLKSMGYNTSVNDLVIKRAELAKKAGCVGVVASAKEAKIIKSKINSFTLVTPGIRVSLEDTQDQKRVMTPYDAIKNGSDFLVIGRAIRDATDPIKITEKILTQIKEAFSKSN